MATIFIQNLSKTIVADNTARPLLQLLQEEFVDWMHACGGKGRCTTCKAVVVEGMENLSERTRAEERYVDKGALLSNERLACQARVMGDICVRVPDESKLPHLTYTD